MISAVGSLFSKVTTKVSSALTVNQATLSGCIDVIVVDQGNGTFKSTPFHVRFGKLKVLKSKEKIVTIEVNGVKANFTMKLGAAGEAFFEQEVHPEESKSGQDGDESPLKFRDDDDELSDPENYSSGEEKEETPSEAQMNDDVPIESQIIEEIRKIEENETATSNLDENQAFSPEKKEEISTMAIDQTESEIKNDLNELHVSDEKDNSELKYQKELLEEIKAELADNSSPDKRWAWGWGRLPQRKSTTSKVPRNTSADKIKPAKPNDVFVVTPNEKASHKETKDDTKPKKNWDSWKFWKREKHSDAAQDKGKAKEANSQVKEVNSSIENKPFVLKPTKELEDIKPTEVPKTDVQKEANGQAKPRVRQFLRPTNEMIKSLNLKPGANQIKYTVRSSFRGDQSVAGKIYLLPKDCKLVISDIDGTITRSDALGQLMPVVGKDWSHKGVANLFNSINDAGYCVLYLTARAIGQSGQTRNYLNKLNQKSSVLPPGPVFMSPDRLIPSFKREVIHRKPEIFKIACLKDIKRLFPPGSRPFYAGFGNRETDAIAYRAIGIKMHNIFLINPKSEIQQLTNSKLLSYEAINTIAKEIFPPLAGAIAGVLEESLQISSEYA